MLERKATGMGLLAPAAFAALLACARAAPPPAPSGVSPISGPDLVRLVRDSGARALLVNVWATWCVPCREEFPELLRLRREYADRGLVVILVSGDFDSELPAVSRFLREQGVDFPTYIKSGKDTEFINALEPRWSGALPATFVYDARGSLRRFWEEKASYATFERHVLEVLQEPAERAAEKETS